MSWLQLFQCQGIWKQNIESICTATYCQESNITVDIPFTEKSFYHLQNTKDTPSQQEFWTVCSFFISYGIARIQAKQISQQRSLLFSSVELALLISGISSSHLRNLNFHWSMFTVKQIISPDGGGAKYHFFWWPFLPLWDAWDTWKWYCSRAGVKLGICFNEESDPIIYFWRSLPPQAIHLSNTFLHCHPNQWQVIFCCTACPTYCCQKSLNESNPAMHP